MRKLIAQKLLNEYNSLIYIQTGQSISCLKLKPEVGNSRHVEWSHFRYILLLHNYSFRVLSHFSPSRSAKFFITRKKGHVKHLERKLVVIQPQNVGKNGICGFDGANSQCRCDNFEQRKAILIQNLLRIWNTAKGQNEFE